MKAISKLLKKHETVVFLDFEGTQFTHEIIAIGAIKCKVNENGIIIEKDKNGFKAYVQAKNPVGKIITEMTSISDATLEEKGMPVDVMLEKFKAYVHEDLKNVSFIVFGTNDAKMIFETNRFSRPRNAYIFKQIIPNIVDYLAFLSQYCRDENLSSYSLTNYLKIFNGTPIGISHDPLNDAIDLMNLYENVLNNPEILLNEYKKILLKQKIFPEPVKKVIKALLEEKDISSETFNDFLYEYLS